MCSRSAELARRAKRERRRALPLFVFTIPQHSIFLYEVILLHEMIAKVIQCGDVTEVVLYERPVPVGFKVDRIRKEKNDDDTPKEKRFDNLVRSQKTVRQLVLTNQTRYTKFVTLTYADTVLQYDQIVHDFKMFMQNMKRYGFPNLPYLYVIEHQKERGKKEGNEGSLHIHCVFFTQKYLPYEVLKRAWGKRGSVDIKAINNIHNLGAYVCKYITKEGYIGDNKPMYHISRGLTRPTEKAMYLDGGHDQGFVIGKNPKETIQDILNGLDIYYQNETQFTYEMNDEEITQRVKYFQGRRKRCSK